MLHGLQESTIIIDPMSVFIVQEFYAQKGPFTKQIATEGFSTVFGQLISPLYHTKSIKPRKFGNIVKFAIE